MYSFESAQTEWEREALQDLKEAPRAGPGALPPPPSLIKEKPKGGDAPWAEDAPGGSDAAAPAAAGGQWAEGPLVGESDDDLR